MISESIIPVLLVMQLICILVGAGPQNICFSLLMLLFFYEQRTQNRRKATWNIVSQIPLIREWGLWFFFFFLSNSVSFLLRASSEYPLSWHLGIPKGPILFFLVAIYAPTNLRFYKKAAGALLVVLLCFSLLGLLTPRDREGRIDTHFTVKPQTSNPLLGINHFAAIISTSTLTTLLVLLHSKSSGTKLFLSLSFLVLILTTVETGSRTTLIGLFAGLLVLGASASRITKKSMLLFFIFAAIVGTLLGARYNVSRVMEGANWRFTLWRKVPGVIARHPFFGSGLRDYTADKGKTPVVFLDAHNDFLSQWLRHGPLAALAFALLYLSLAKWLWTNARHPSSSCESWRTLLAKISLGSFVIGTVFGLTLYTWTSNRYGIFFFSLIAMAFGPGRTSIEEASLLKVTETASPIAPSPS